MSVTGQPLSRLREHFRDPLLIKKGRQLVLSPAAQALAPGVAKAIAAMTDVFEQSLGREGRPPYVLACADLFGAAIVPGLLARLARDAPGATLEARAIPARSTIQILEDGADVVLGAFEDVPPLLGQRHLFSDPFVCVVRADHPRIGRTMTLERYLELSHIEVLPAPNSGPGLRIERALGARAAQRRVSLRVPYFSIAGCVLALGDEILTMTHFFARELQRQVPIKIVPSPIELPALRFSMVWHRERDGDREHQRFRELVALECLERVRKHPRARRS